MQYDDGVKRYLSVAFRSYVASTLTTRSATNVLSCIKQRRRQVENENYFADGILQRGCLWYCRDSSIVHLRRGESTIT